MSSNMPDDAIMMAGLKNMEAGLHRAGWDRNNTLFPMFWNGNALIAGENVGGPDACPGFKTMKALTHVIRTEDAGRALADKWAAVGFVALGYASEGWANTNPADSPRFTGRSLGDVPGSVEVRSLIALDVRGRAWMVFRMRGQKPVVSNPVVGGQNYPPMRDVVLAVAEHMPPGAADIEALRNLHVMSQEELHERVQAMQERKGTS